MSKDPEGSGMEDLTCHLLRDARRGEECSGNGKSCLRREWRRDLGLALDEHSQRFATMNLWLRGWRQRRDRIILAQPSVVLV